MKVGIYISGLGQSVVNETVEKYVERLKNELCFDTHKEVYEIRKGKERYMQDRDCTVISIWQTQPEEKMIYKIYEFDYHEMLTVKFNSSSLIIKNFRLFLLMISKFPLILKRLFVSNGYNRPLQTLYIFLIFMIISTAVLLMVPASISSIGLMFEQPAVTNLLNGFKELIGTKDIPVISKEGFKQATQLVVLITAPLLLIVPNANVLLTNLAIEFLCVNDYMQYGAQRQLILGNLEQLVEYVTENEEDCTIHFHAYSFGSILAIDYLYPLSGKPSRNVRTFCKALITIGSPFEFVKSYYPQFCVNRVTDMDSSIQWINVYSISDAFATNFRSNAQIGDAEFGILKHSARPHNLNYEVVLYNKHNIIDFFTLQSIKAHSMYWDNRPEGNSCLSLIYEAMKERELL